MHTAWVKRHQTQQDRANQLCWKGKKMFLLQELDWKPEVVEEKLTTCMKNFTSSYSVKYKLAFFFFFNDGT